MYHIMDMYTRWPELNKAETGIGIRVIATNMNAYKNMTMETSLLEKPSIP